MPDGSVWPAQTRAWWRQWKVSPLAGTFTALEWSELLAAAVLHGMFWSGDTKVASELRLRVAKFGVTPEDRQRLRVELVVPEPERAASPSRSLRLVAEEAGRAVEA